MYHINEAAKLVFIYLTVFMEEIMLFILFTASREIGEFSFLEVFR